MAHSIARHDDYTALFLRGEFMTHDDLIVLLKLFCLFLASFGLIVLDIMHDDEIKCVKRRTWKLRDKCLFAVNQNKEAAT